MRILARYSRPKRRKLIGKTESADFRKKKNTRRKTTTKERLTLPTYCVYTLHIPSFLHAKCMFFRVRSSLKKTNDNGGDVIRKDYYARRSKRDRREFSNNFLLVQKFVIFFRLSDNSNSCDFLS